MPKSVVAAFRAGMLFVSLLLLGGCETLFPKAATPELAHFAEQSPAVGTQLPDLRVFDLQGRSQSLPSYSQGRPLIVQLGSHTCPVYRYRRFSMGELKREFAGRVDFVTVYTLEAHPRGSPSPYRDEEWVSVHNHVARVYWKQTSTLAERLAQANRSTAELAAGEAAAYGPVVVDDIDNRVWSAHGAAPSAAFLFDADGQMVLKQVWVNPHELRDRLTGMLGP